MEFKGIRVVQSEKRHAGDGDFWVPINDPSAIRTIHNPNEPGTEERYWYELHHEAGHVTTLSESGDKGILQKIRRVLPKEKEGLIHKPSRTELEADLYAFWAWIQGTGLEEPYKAKTTQQIYSYDHNLARRLFFNIIETGEVFGPQADVTKLEGEYAVVGATDVGKSRLVNYLLREEVERVAHLLCPEPPSEVSRYEGHGLVLWDTPHLCKGGSEKFDNSRELEEKTLQFLSGHSGIPLIYAIFPHPARDPQIKTLERMLNVGNIKQVVLTRGDDPNCLDGKFVHDYGNQLSGKPITISTVTGEGMYKLIANLIKQ